MLDQDALISPDYRRLITHKHDDRPWGGTGVDWAPLVATLLNYVPGGNLTILDFGCGRGTFKPAIEMLNPEVSVREYDPGVRGKDDLNALRFPVTYVVATDVLEHVEADKLPYTLRTLDFLAVKGIFFVIDLCESGSSLPDGRNTHITLRPMKWWTDMLRTHFADMEWTIHEASACRLVVSGLRVKHVE